MFNALQGSRFGKCKNCMILSFLLVQISTIIYSSVRKNYSENDALILLGLLMVSFFALFFIIHILFFIIRRFESKDQFHYRSRRQGNCCN